MNGCEIEVEDDVKWSEITLITRSLDLNSEFYNAHVYSSDANTSDRALMELHLIRYRSQQVEIGYDQSFAMCNAEMVYLERDNDDIFFKAISLEFGTRSKHELWIKSENG